MRIKKKRPDVRWMVLILSAATLGAASDLRLVDAAEKGDKEAVRFLLKQHLDINTAQADGTTALAWAAYRDDLEMADILIGANVNRANDYGVTPLSLACANGSAAMVDKLLKAGADANAMTGTGETPLMECARSGNVEAVKSLLARGANVKASEKRQGHTALMWAVAAKQPEAAGTLIEHGADVNARSKGGFTPLLFAAQQGDINSARILLGAGAGVNDATPDGDTPLLVASSSGHEELSIFLLDKGADANAAERNGITALHYAVMKGLVEITGISMTRTFAPYLYRPNMLKLAKALLAHGANPNASLVSPTVAGTGPGYSKIIRIDNLNVGGGRVSPVGATPFILAALSYDADLMRLLLANGADPRRVTEEKVTALMAAAGVGRQRGGPPPITEEEESRALEAVKLAVELGADVNAAENNTLLTALHGAALFGSNRIIQFLAEKGANLEVKDKAGQTPLHKAANIQPKGAAERNLYPFAYRKSTVDLLLKLGASPLETSVAQGADNAVGQ